MLTHRTVINTAASVKPCKPSHTPFLRILLVVLDLEARLIPPQPPSWIVKTVNSLTEYDLL